MSLFEKLKTAIRGNPVFKEYELGKHVCSAGPGLLWRVYDGVKKTTKQGVSLFVFFKKIAIFEKLPKKGRSAILEMLKKGPTHLVKLRHPQLLRVEHAMVESSDCIVFVTEPVSFSLANVLGDYENLPSPLPLSIKEHQFHPVEVKYGLLQLAEGLSFLHNDVKMFHGNLTPENVIINQNGEWKLGGFNFCCYTQYLTSAQTSFQFQEYDTGKPLHTQPSLDYLAPEYILAKSCTPQSDMYSMGMLIYAIYNRGRPLFENRNNVLSYKSNVEQVSRITNSILGNVPEEIKDSIRAMLSPEPAVRIESLQMTKAAFFDDPLITSLHTLDGLCKQSDIVKSQFYKSLHQTITQLPRRMVVQKIFPALVAEFHNHKMIPFVLPSVLMIAEESSSHEYAFLILPALVPVFTVQDPIQVPLILLQNMELLLKKSSPAEVKEYLLPMIVGALNSNREVQELCVSVLPSFAGSIDYTSLKHTIIPMIMALCLSTPYLAVRIKGLVSVGSMLDVLDKSIIINQIMPSVYQLENNEPGVSMAILGICHGALQRPRLGFEKDYLAMDVLPYLIPKSTQPTLNVSQFQKFMVVIKEMLAKIQKDHQEFLEHDQAMQKEMRSTIQLTQDVKEAKKAADTTSGIEAMSNPNQDVSVSARRGAAVSSPPSTSVKSVTSTSSNADADWLLSLNDSVTPVQQQPTSSPSLFAGLSVKESVVTPSKPPGNMTYISDLKPDRTLQPQSTIGTTMYNQQANATSSLPFSAASSNQPLSSGPPLMQPLPATYNQSVSQPPQDGVSYQMHASPIPQPPSMLQPTVASAQSNAPAMNARTPPITEAPPPYAGHENQSSLKPSYLQPQKSNLLASHPVPVMSIGIQQPASNVTQMSQLPTQFPGVPNMDVINFGAHARSDYSIGTGIQSQPMNFTQMSQPHQPQQPSLQLNKGMVNPRNFTDVGQLAGSSMSMGSTQTGNFVQTPRLQMQPTTQSTGGMLPPQSLSSMGQFTSSAMSGAMQHPQHTTGGSIANSSQAMNFEPMPQLQTQPVIAQPARLSPQPSWGSSNQRGFHGSLGQPMLLPQNASAVPAATTGIRYGNGGVTTTTTGEIGVFHQPLMAPSSSQATSSYVMSPGPNPFSDIKDLLG